MTKEINVISEEKNELAKILFVQEDKPIAEIAKAMNVSEGMVRDWCNTGSWENLKRVKPTSKTYQLGQLYSLMDNLVQKMKEAKEVNSKDADLVVKYTAAIKNLDVETTIPQIVEVAKLFITWLHTKNRELAKTFAHNFDGFIRHRFATTQ